MELSRPSIQTVRKLIQMGDGRWALRKLISGDTSPNLWPLAGKTEYPELRLIPETPNTRSQTKELVGLASLIIQGRDLQTFPDSGSCPSVQGAQPRQVKPAHDQSP